jgi:hypothetical protein
VLCWVVTIYDELGQLTAWFWPITDKIEGRRLHHFDWTPGIGDPTIGGWITVVLYFLAAISCWMTARHKGARGWKIWVAISILFLGLGINKQLDLQSALTELGRTVAFQQGWYEQRELVQIDFIVFVATVCAVAVVAFVVGARRAGPAAWFAILGTALVIGFVLIRAASFHHIDRFIGQKILGFRWNWVLEMGGICVVLLASEWRRRTT